MSERRNIIEEKFEGTNIKIKDIYELYQERFISELFSNFKFSL